MGMQAQETCKIKPSSLIIVVWQLVQQRVWMCQASSCYLIQHQQHIRRTWVDMILQSCQEIWITRAILKVMTPIFSHWSIITEANVGATALEAEPPHQDFIPFSCRVTCGRREAVWQWFLMRKGVWSKGMKSNSSIWKKCHPLIFIDTY